MIANGAGVVFQVAGQCGLGVLSAAKEKGVFGIGVDADQGYLGAHVMTSATKKVDVAVYQTIDAARKTRATFRTNFNAIFTVDERRRRLREDLVPDLAGAEGAGRGRPQADRRGQDQEHPAGPARNHGLGTTRFHGRGGVSIPPLPVLLRV